MFEIPRSAVVFPFFRPLLFDLFCVAVGTVVWRWSERNGGMVTFSLFSANCLRCGKLHDFLSCFLLPYAVGFIIFSISQPCLFRIVMSALAQKIHLEYNSCDDKSILKRRPEKALPVIRCYKKLFFYGDKGM